MWPFMKLRNGFGSHRYVYSPILFDSQDLNTFYFHTHFSYQLRDQHASVYTLRWLASGNAGGDANGYQLSCILVPAAGAAPEDNYGDRVSADGQWKCVRPAQLHPGSRCMRQSWYYDKYARVVANVECRRLPSQVPGSCCMQQVYSYIFWFGFSNGEWRRYSWISAHAAGDASGRFHVLSAYLGDNAPMEAMEDEENIHIKLSARV